MAYSVEIRCKCGTVRGRMNALGREHAPPRLRPCNHFVCMCDDCQAYARFLGQPDILDDNGGTEVVQVMQKQLELLAGQDAVRCVRLSHKGMHRWYAGCCRTPLANTLGPGSPFAGVFRSCLVVGDAESASVFGPIKERVFAKYATGELPPNSSQTASFGFLVTTLPKILWWALCGGGRHSPFFSKQGKPLVAPDVLDAGVRAALTGGSLAQKVEGSVS